MARKPWTEEQKAALREKIKAKWQDPAYVAAFKNGYSTHKNKLQKEGTSEEVKSKISKGLSKSWTKERKQKASKTYTESWASDEDRKKETQERMKRTWKDPQKRETLTQSIRQATQTEENRKRASVHATTLWQSEEHKENIARKTSANWNNAEYRKAVHPNSYTEEFLSKYDALKKETIEGKSTFSYLCDKHDFSRGTFKRMLQKDGETAILDNLCNTSGPQTEIISYIKELGFEVESNNRKAIAPFELDAYIPKINLAIEYNGLYWHSEAKEKQRNKHYDKYQLCRSKNISLFAIFEDEWEHKKELILSMIRHRLNCSTAQPLYARDLIVKNVSPQEAKTFFDINHIDGGLFLKGIGLFHKEKLVMAMSVRPYSTSGEYKGYTEVARMATDYNYRIIGGASKLIKTIKGGIVTYSNNRLSNGATYAKLGFIEDTASTSPSYWYTDLDSRVFRTRCQRSNDETILAKFATEEIQAKNGVFSQKIFGDSRSLYRIEDYGHRRWIKAT